MLSETDIDKILSKMFDDEGYCLKENFDVDSTIFNNIAQTLEQKGLLEANHKSAEAGSMVMVLTRDAKKRRQLFINKNT